MEYSIPRLVGVSGFEKKNNYRDCRTHLELFSNLFILFLCTLVVTDVGSSLRTTRCSGYYGFSSQLFQWWRKWCTVLECTLYRASNFLGLTNAIFLLFFRTTPEQRAKPPAFHFFFIVTANRHFVSCRLKPPHIKREELTLYL